MQLIDKGPGVREDEHATLFNAIVAKQVSDDLGHHYRLPKAGCKHDLGAAGIDERPFGTDPRHPPGMASGLDWRAGTRACSPSFPSDCGGPRPECATPCAHIAVSRRETPRPAAGTWR